MTPARLFEIHDSMMARGVAVLAMLWIGGCQECLERCAGLWSVTFDGGGALADGEYELIATPDVGDPLQGRCSVSEGGTQAVCEGELSALSNGDPSGYGQLSFGGGDTATAEVEVRLTLDGAVLIEETIELAYDDGDSCNPHCSTASHTLEI